MAASRRARLTADERRALLVRAGAEAFASAGYRATSVAQICRAAGVTQPVFYDHFASKRALFETILSSARDALLREAEAIMLGDAPPRERIRRTVDHFFAFVEAHPALARTLLFGARGEPELEPIHRAVQREATAGVAAILAKTIDKRRARDRVLVRAEFIKQGLHGLVEWWDENPDVPRATLVDVVMELLWGGLGDGKAA